MLISALHHAAHGAQARNTGNCGHEYYTLQVLKDPI